MTSITFTIPLPPHEVRNNARCHYRVKAAKIKFYRRLAMYAAREAAGWKKPMWLKASAKVVAFFPTAQRMDPTNLLDALKGPFDGLEDAGIIVNDKNLWPERPVLHTKQTNPRIEITITEETL
jgi:Holliday junction resolvase RusA-like endonuclease